MSMQTLGLGQFLACILYSGYPWGGSVDPLQVRGRLADTSRAHTAQGGRQPAREHHTSYKEDQVLPPDLTSQHRGFQGLGAPARRVQRGRKWVQKYVRHGVSAND